ncbi:hypothetical protein [Planctomyces sp. SH-PL62]|uniref:hypothetical protein n=1 Tax=Planctomyces sp. SH-PL62 TaxID=1636152 RepID=UPI00078D9B87|nr:hypothetical protein [Planctomyces sp. SH-PL62]AMV40198.1 hypothetical protein VT85_22390 [Planctomyces sp. SH-PL62]
MKTHALPPTPTSLTFLQDLDDILGGTTFGTPVERGRRTAFRPTAARPCDGCGDPAPAVDLWAEHPETGEQLWLCLACGD